MLVINHQSKDFYDERSSEFKTLPEFTIELEHSLASLSKWEQIWEKPFLSDTPKSQEETLSYIQQMCLSEIPTIEDLDTLTQSEMAKINEYINAKMTATWFNERPEPGRAREIVTAEVIYYWMTLLNIPFEWETQHFNKLITLIKVANAKNAPQKKRTAREMAAERRAENAARLQKFGTKG